MIKVGLVFSISNFFINKIPREGNWVQKANTYLKYFSLSYESFIISFFQFDEQCFWKSIVVCFLRQYLGLCIMLSQYQAIQLF